MKIDWKYTFGEIIIVIIGISIAFGLNNWWASRKDAELEQEYLQNIQLDLKEDLEHLKASSAQFKTKLQIIEQLRPHLYAEIPRKDSVVQKFFQLLDLIKFFPNKGTYNALLNSGDLNLIRDFDLRTRLESHYNFYQEVAYEEERQVNFHKNFMSEFTMNKINYDQLYRGDLSFLKEPELKNLFFAIQGISMLGQKKADEGVGRVDEMLKQLEGSQAEN